MPACGVSDSGPACTDRQGVFLDALLAGVETTADRVLVSSYGARTENLRRRTCPTGRPGRAGDDPDPPPGLGRDPVPAPSDPGRGLRAGGGVQVTSS